MPSAPSAPRPKLTKEQALVLQIQTARARGRQHYQKAAAQEKELMALAKPGTAIEMPDGRRFAVVDQYAGKDLLKKLVFFDRFELEELK